MKNWDQRTFEETMVEYSKVSSRTAESIVNTKAFYVARRAVVETPKAMGGKIRSQLMRQQVVAEKILAQRVRFTKRGVVRGKFITQKIKGGPLAALILNRRRGLADQRGLHGAAMAEAVNALIAVRMKSIAFLKSGWLQAIHELEPLADRRGAPPLDRSAKVYGVPKGESKPAREGDNPTAVIINEAIALRDRNNALIKFGQPALERAVEFERQSMVQYMRDRLRPHAERFNGRQR